MTYFIHFYEECSATGMDIEIEITFTCEEKEDQENFWGYLVSVPASKQIEIQKVLRIGESWYGYPDSITDEIHKYDWIPETDFSGSMAEEPETEYFKTPKIYYLNILRIAA